MRQDSDFLSESYVRTPYSLDSTICERERKIWVLEIYQCFLLSYYYYLRARNLGGRNLPVLLTILLSLSREREIWVAEIYQCFLLSTI